MQPSEELRKSIRTERMRMAQVRKAFGAVLDQSPQDLPQTMDFYTACCNYLESALGRLQAQDQKIIELLTPLVPEDAHGDREILTQFQDGLDAIKVALHRLTEGLARYRQTAGQGQAAFEQEARAFLDVFINVLAARRHTSSHLEDQHFDAADWEAVAFASDGAKRREAELYSAVQRSAPEGVDPDRFQVGPPK